jgi:hypothetical protein
MSAFFVCLFSFFLGKFLNTFFFFFFAMIMQLGSTSRAEQACRWSSAATLVAALYDAATDVSQRQLQN